MLDRVDAGEDRGAYALVAMGVRRDPEAEHVGLVDDRLHLLEAQLLSADRVAVREDPAGGADLRPLGPGREHLPGPRPVELLGALEQRDADRRHRVWGNPRSTFDVAGSGQREVTTLPRV